MLLSSFFRFNCLFFSSPRSIAYEQESKLYGFLAYFITNFTSTLVLLSYLYDDILIAIDF